METLLDPISTALLVAAVIGATEAVRRGFQKDVEAVVIILVASLLGGIIGVLLVGFTAPVFFSGVAVGLGASGVVTLGQVVGGTRSKSDTIKLSK